MSNPPEVLYPFPLGVLPAQIQSALLSAAIISPNYPFTVLLRGEKVAIPVRLYARSEKLWPAEDLPDIQKPFANCLLTRHCDGFIRAAALDKVLAIKELWAMPFIVQLIGEYVVEILDQIEQRFDEIDARLLESFAQENPRFIELVRRRVYSYWDAYYRHIPRRNYVGLRLVRRLKEAAQPKKRQKAAKPGRP